MKNKVGIVDYGLSGNVYNIQKAIEKAGGIVYVIDNIEDFNKIDKIVIPGVGNFKDAIWELKQKDLITPLIENINTKPTLGICLGMQLLSTFGYESSKTDGLKIINAKVVPLNVDEVIPHVGFNKIDKIKDSKILNGLEDEEFYFMHSYEMLNFHDVAATTTYCEHQFVSAVEKGDVFGVQFHPEKSREAGIKLFENFLNI